MRRAVVIDASVAWKWFDRDEALANEALALFDMNHEIVVPDLIGPELFNIAWKRVRREEMSSDAATEMFATIAAGQLRIEPTIGLLSHAWSFATTLDHSVYDCVYLALAVARKCQLITADREFYVTVAASPLASHIRWIEDGS